MHVVNVKVVGVVLDARNHAACDNVFAPSTSISIIVQLTQVMTKSILLGNVAVIPLAQGVRSLRQMLLQALLQVVEVVGKRRLGQASARVVCYDADGREENRED